MKFWELIRQPPRERDPDTGAFVPLHKSPGANSVDAQIRHLAKSTDHLSPEVKRLCKMLAESDLTSEQIAHLVSKHHDKDDIMLGYRAIVKAMQLRPGGRSTAFLRRKGEHK